MNILYARTICNGLFRKVAQFIPALHAVYRSKTNTFQYRYECYPSTASSDTTARERGSASDSGSIRADKIPRVAEPLRGAASDPPLARRIFIHLSSFVLLSPLLRYQILYSKPAIQINHPKNTPTTPKRGKKLPEHDLKGPPAVVAALAAAAAAHTKCHARSGGCIKCSKGGTTAQPVHANTKRLQHPQSRALWQHRQCRAGSIPSRSKNTR